MQIVLGLHTPTRKLVNLLVLNANKEAFTKPTIGLRTNLNMGYGKWLRSRAIQWFVILDRFLWPLFVREFLFEGWNVVYKICQYGLSEIPFHQFNGTHISLKHDPFAVSPIDGDVMVYGLSALLVNKAIFEET